MATAKSIVSVKNIFQQKGTKVEQKERNEQKINTKIRKKERDNTV